MPCSIRCELEVGRVNSTFCPAAQTRVKRLAVGGQKTICHNRLECLNNRPDYRLLVLKINFAINMVPMIH
eukprot:5630804-Amphidinium_carterae.1